MAGLNDGAATPPGPAEADIRLHWNDYKDQAPDAAAEAIYAYIAVTADDIIGWYWKAIGNKKKAALWVRGIAFAFLLLGVVSQIYSASVEPVGLRLHYTQGALALLAIGGLLLQGDRAFGWTSGWTRYITTAMMMESLYRDFKLKWARYQVSRTQPLTRDDMATLFELASVLEGQLLKARSEETAAWAAEFHAGLQLLESAIKTQRETTEKKLDELSATFDKKEEQARQQSEADKNASKLGAVELTLRFKAGPKAVKLGWDQEPAVDLVGTSWARLSVTPGKHRVQVTLVGDPPVSAAKVIDVAPGATVREELLLEA